MIFHCIDRSQFVYPSADGHLDLFPFLALTNNAAVKVEVYEVYEMVPGAEKVLPK